MSKVELADINFFEEGLGTPTPWGRAQYAQQLAVGATWYGTANHGGLCVTATWLENNLTPHARFLGQFWGQKFWYEKDYACFIVFLEHPELFQRKQGTTPKLERVEEAVRKSCPKYFDKEFQAASLKAVGIPNLKDLTPGDTLTVYYFGYPRNERSYTLLGVSNKNVSAFVEDDCGGKLSIPRTTIMNDLLRVEREDKIVWERP